MDDHSEKQKGILDEQSKDCGGMSNMPLQWSIVDRGSVWQCEALLLEMFSAMIMSRSSFLQHFIHQVRVQSKPSQL